MSKRFMRLTVIACLLFTAGLVAFANQYNVSGLSFSGVMTGPGDSDWLDLGGQEGTNPTVCLSHGGGVDFDVAVYNDGNQVCSNLSMDTYTCCSAYTPGHVRVRIWAVSGSGSYSVTIRP